MERKKNFFLKLILLFSGCFLFCLANPNVFFTDGLSLLGWICLVPVFLLVYFSNKKNLFIWGFLYGFITYGLYVFWLCNYNLWAYILVLIFYGLIHSILFYILKITDSAFPKCGWIIEACIFVSFEYIRSLGFLGFSFGGLGYTQWKSINTIQICKVGGVWLLSFFMSLTSAFVYGILMKFNKYLRLRKIFENEKHDASYTPLDLSKKIDDLQKEITFIPEIVLVLVLIAMITGMNVYGKNCTHDFSKYKKITVCAVQNNENVWADGIEVYAQNVQKLKALTDEALEFNPDIQMVVWPETSVATPILKNYYVPNDLGREKLVTSILEYINRHNCAFVIGNSHSVPDKSGQYNYYNSALYFLPRKNVIPPEPVIYSKQHLVPFAEKFPFECKLKDVLKSKGLNFWTPGKEVTVFDFAGLSFSTPICFEDNFGSITRKMALNGARCFINLSSDGWSNSKVCQKQHLAMSVIRSCETGLPTVRSCTTGETCIINPDGKIISSCSSFVESYCYASVVLLGDSYKPTLYTRYGNVFILSVCAISVVMLLIGGIRIIIRKVKDN